jgi:hypothetical protein
MPMTSPRKTTYCMLRSSCDSAELARLTQERAIVQFAPATEETVAAARDAVAAAERTRVAERGDGDPKQRGPNCRQRESEEQAKRQALTVGLTGKAATDQASNLDRAAAVVRLRLASAMPVENPTPLGPALTLMLGAGAAVLTLAAGSCRRCLRPRPAGDFSKCECRCCPRGPDEVSRRNKRPPTGATLTRSLRRRERAATEER